MTLEVKVKDRKFVCTRTYTS